MLRKMAFCFREVVHDRKGVFTLPVNLLIAIIIGGIVLGMVIYYLSQQCFFPDYLKVYWEPDVVNDSQPCNIFIRVYDSRGSPIAKASVIISGLGEVNSNITIANGTTVVKIFPHLPSYKNEGYLNIKVNAGKCYKNFFQENAIKVVR